MTLPIDTLEVIIPFCDDVRNFYYLRKSGPIKDQIVEIMKNANINWAQMSCYWDLSEDFMREFKNQLSWEYISEKQVLSEDFIREMNDYVQWIMISDR
jgi:hypothetical protein